ncbi:hypothetical protein [Asanoa sp. NPDC050611]|uniref:hypothetical protein n=1 Tax=Asanoa sp. NPDC050611 TaxID=3157098 RepID=UPI0033E75115
MATHAPSGDATWAPAWPIVGSTAVAALALVAASRISAEDSLGRYTAPLIYQLCLLGVVAVALRATVERGRHFAARGVPEAWTRALLRDTGDADLVRWRNLMRRGRPPMPEERARLLTAARARAEGLPSILTPATVGLTLAVVSMVLAVRQPGTLLGFARIPNIPVGVLLAVVTVRYAALGAESRAYLTRFRQPDDPRHS